MKIVFYIAFLFITTASNCIGKNKQLIKGEQAPDFVIEDIFGNEIKLSSFKGGCLVLSFRRYAACPICNARSFEIEKSAESFQENNIRVIQMYESSKETLLEYLGNEKPFMTIIPDPTLSLYKLFGVERSNWKVIKGIGKANSRKEFDHKKPEKDGTTNRIPADFLIDENGTIILARYQEYLGDELPIEEIFKRFGSTE